MVIVKINVDKATFDAMHAADRMATDKLKEGIEGFSAALVKLEGAAGRAPGRTRAAHAGNRLTASQSREQRGSPGCPFCFVSMRGPIF